MDIDWSAESRDAGAELEAQARQKKRREAKPLLYCKIVSRWPIKSFFVTLLFHFAMLLITGILLQTGYDIFPVYFDELPLRITHEPWDARFYAWRDRNTYPGHYERSGKSTGYRASMERFSSIDIVYIAGAGGNIFTKEVFMEMRELEMKLQAVNDYDKYCQLNPQTQTCVKPISILRFFDGSYQHVNAVFNDTEFDNVAAVINEAFKNNATEDRIRYFLCNDYEISETTAECSMTRAIIPIGTPHKDFDRFEDFKTHIQTYEGENFKQILETGMEESKTYSFVFRSQALWAFDATTQAFSDMLWVGGSIGFIFVLILYHTSSLWVAGLAIFSICMSFVTGNLVYNIVYGYQYIGFFHVLALFIVLGIGADDVFVFYDIWRSSAFDEYPSLAHRLSDVYRRSAFSMLFTSLTTTVAFLSSAIAPLLPTRAFGIFSATVVVVNYLSVIVFFPNVVVMYHLYFEKTQWPCCEPCRSIRRMFRQNKNQTGEQDSQVHESKDAYNDKKEKQYQNNEMLNPVYDVSSDPDIKWQMNLLNKSRFFIKRPNYSATSSQGTSYMSDKPGGEFNVVPISQNGDLAQNHISNGHVPKSKRGHAYEHTNPAYTSDSHSWSNQLNGHQVATPTPGSGPRPSGFESNNSLVASTMVHKRKKKALAVRFFTNYYFRFVTHPVIRWIILVLLAGLLGFFIYQASRLDIYADEPVAVFPEDHHFPKTLNYKLDNFVKSDGDETITLYLVFGMKENNLDECPFSKPVCEGDRQWDAAFDPNTVEAQLALQRICKTLRDVSRKENEELRMRTSVTGQYNIKCFAESLEAFLEDESARTGGNWTLPFTRDKMMNFMSDRSQHYNVSSFNTSEFTNYLEIPLSYWLFNGYSGSVGDDFVDYDPLIGEEIGTFSTEYNGAKYGNKIKYLAVEIELDIQFRTSSYVDGIPVRDKWEEFFAGQLKSMPDGLKEGIQSSWPEIYSFWTTKKMVVYNSVYGIAIGVGLACPILIVATGNIITGLLATLSLLCCTVCVVGVIPLGGWELGFLEALNMCMVVGLAVDYVVHLAEGYTHSLHNDRLSRVRDMLDEMAVSVFFGACTSLGAAAFMFLTKLSFFQQFGIFMFSTLGFSFLFAMGLFVTLLGIIGPENNTGEFMVLFKKCCNRRNGRN